MKGQKGIAKKLKSFTACRNNSWKEVCEFMFLKRLLILLSCTSDCLNPNDFRELVAGKKRNFFLP